MILEICKMVKLLVFLNKLERPDVFLATVNYYFDVTAAL